MSIPISWIRKSCACGLVAWAVATPIVFHHFGIISPAGAMMSIVAAPLVSAIIILAVSSITLSISVPWCVNPMGPIASLLAGVLNQLAEWFSSLPGCCFVAAPPSVLWVVGCELLVWRTVLHRKSRERMFLLMLALTLGGIIVTPSCRDESDQIMISTLDVGNGTCHLVEGPSGWSMVDAG